MPPAHDGDLYFWLANKLAQKSSPQDLTDSTVEQRDSDESQLVIIMAKHAF